MQATEIGLAGAGIASILGMGLAFLCGIACLVFWIMTIVKQFQAEDTVWGILTIFIGILGLVWLFMKGHTKLAVWWTVFLLLSIVGSVIVAAGILGAAAMSPGIEGMPVPPKPVPIQ